MYFAMMVLVPGSYLAGSVERTEGRLLYLAARVTLPYTACGNFFARGHGRMKEGRSLNLKLSVSG